MQPVMLKQLKARIRRIEGRTIKRRSLGETGRNARNALRPPLSWSFGMPEIDQLFPAGLSPRGLHEIAPKHYKDSPAALSFALALLARRASRDQRPILWCSSAVNISEFGRLYGHGLRRFNLAPERFIIIETRNERETAFVLEEALQSAKLCAVLGLVNDLPLTPSRRLSLMAAKGQTPALLVTRAGDGHVQTALTRWQVAASLPDPQMEPAFSFHQSSWQVALTRNRQGPADKQWHLEFPFHDRPFGPLARKAFCFTHPSPFRNRKPGDHESNIHAA